VHGAVLRPGDRAYLSGAVSHPRYLIRLGRGAQAGRRRRERVLHRL